MPFIAYKIAHRESGKGYVGVTTRTFAVRRKEHRNAKSASKNRLSGAGRAIAKHGWAAFDMEHIASATCLNDLLALESILIDQEGTLAPHGYNMALSRDGVWFGSDETRVKLSVIAHNMSAETKARIGAAGKGRKASAETCAKIGAVHRGRKRSPETIAKITAALLARPPASEETRRKIAASNAGKIPTTEHRQKIAAAHIGRVFSDETRHKMSVAAQRKLPVSDETRQRLSQALKGKPKSVAWCEYLSARQRGRVLSSETKARISASLRARAGRVAVEFS